MKQVKDNATLQPSPSDQRLTRRVDGLDHTGATVTATVVVERPLTLFLNGQEIVTMMTVGDYPDHLAVGYLLNQGMLLADDTITGVEFDDDLGVVVVRTRRQTDYEDKIRKKTLTSGCAQGTVFGDLMERFETIRLAPEARLKNIVALCAAEGDQHHAQPLPHRGRDPWLRAVQGRASTGLYGGRGPPQCRR